ncbi:ankyrin repeat-containing domain protein [Xylariaceae sp. FL1019]|nr:ankyrin repeat-containing domain protein [Xylariaceae sp. FL1019]
MSSTKSSRSKQTADTEDVSDHESGFAARRSIVRAYNPQQTVLAHTFTSNGDISFASEGGPPSSVEEATYQSIHASTVSVGGGITYATSNNYYGDRSQRKISIPEWLSSSSPLHFDRKHRDTIEIFRKTPETGQWFLSDPKFQAWKRNSFHRLLCSGIPGAGKTVLASIVIDHLKARIKGDSRDNSAACIYVYFDHNDREPYTILNLYLCLLAQLVQHRDHFSKELNIAFRHYQEKAMFPSPSEILDILITEMSSFSRIDIILDALDECSSEVGNIRAEFMKTVRIFPDNVFILATTRPDLEISREMKASEELTIAAHDEDLKKYLDGYRNDAAQGKLQALVASAGETFWPETVDTIIEKSQGMFLLAQLHMDFLNLRNTIGEFKDGLRTLPGSPEGVYQRTFERILRIRDDFKKTLAIRSLGWLIFAERPLTISELLCAVAIKPESQNHADLDIVSKEILSSACAGIIVIESKTKVVRLAHYTARQYLEDNEASRFRNFQSVMAESCLTYLRFNDFTPSSQGNPKEQPLLNYAANHWGDHVFQGVLGTVHKLACEFLADDQQRNNALDAMTETRLAPEDPTALHICAYFGVANLARKLINRGMCDINSQTVGGKTAMHWATFYRQHHVLKLLLAEKADVNVKDKRGRTALHLAVEIEDAYVVKAILKSKNRVKMDVEELDSGWTPLRYAAACGLKRIVRLLIDNNADVNAEDKDGFTALRWAAYRGHKKIVDMLVDGGASLDRPKKCAQGWTLLAWSAREGRDAFVQSMIQKGIDLDEPNADGETALYGAVKYGRGTAAYLLLQAKANVELPDRRLYTPLHVAVDVYDKSSDKTLIWLLIESGANINAKTRQELTPLHIAASKGYATVVWLLLEKGANPMGRNSY